MTPTYTIAEVAERFSLTPQQVKIRCLRKKWPHLRPSARDATTWCFTAAQVEQIEDLLAHGGVPVDSWGREVRRIGRAS